MLRATEELQARTNGWGHALADAKGKVAALAGSFIAMKKAASLSISFESDMAGVRKTVDGSKEEIEALGNELRRMSTEIPVAAGELARIAAIGGQLGIAREEIARACTPCLAAATIPAAMTFLACAGKLTTARC